MIRNLKRASAILSCSCGERRARKGRISMDLLKRELQKKRQSLENDFGGRKLLKRSEIEQKMIQKLREEEQRQLQSKALRSSFPSAPNPSHQSSLPPSLCSNKPLSEERRIDDLDLPRHEVIRRLRILKQPVTLFGEDDEARLRRLKVTLNSGPLEIDDTDMTEGQTNDFLRDIYELRRRQKIGILHDRAKPKMEDGERTEGSGTADGGAADNEVSGDGGSSGVDVDKDLKRMKADFLDLCDEDKILVFFKRLLNEWNQELEEMPEAEKRTAKGKFMVATFNQCARYLNPLFKMCRKKDEDVMYLQKVNLMRRIPASIYLEPDF